MHSFAKYSKYYDLLYQDKNYPSEVDFISKLLDSYPPKGSSILELGCGTGCHATLLAEKKWNIEGLDLSDQMLHMAEERKKTLPEDVANRLTFKLGDVRNFNTGKQYDVIVALFHVLSYQTSNRDVLEMLKCVYKHLSPGGVFIFDYWYVPAVLTEKPSVKIKRMQSFDLDVTRIAEPVMYPNSSIVEVNYEIQIRDRRIEKTETLHETHRMRYFFLNDIDFFLAQVGLRLISSSEWLTNKEPGFDTWGVCSVAMK
jgi:SAM-dependent methyltransferase